MIHCLGYVPNASQAESRGKKLLHQSGHYSAHLRKLDDGEGEENGEDDVSDKTANKPYDTDADYMLKTDKAQDWHAVLSVTMASLKDFLEHGLVWDYKCKAKLYKGVEFVPYIHCIKCDGDEADKLTGHFRSRGKHVQCVCRCCVCPSADADNVNANYKLKTEADIQRLVDREDLHKLKQWSQQNIQNAFYKMRFGLHSKQGVHGACPMELLHHILLGIYQCGRDCFFLQIGKDSMTAKDVNGLAKEHGAFFARQSDRNLPKTNFAKGTFEGKIMGKEHRGVLLNMAAILQSKMGKDLLMQKRSFRVPGALEDWSMLVETLLEWEAFLMLDTMKLKDVKRLKRKHRVLMYLIKRVFNRTKGVGMKFMKFHGILHLLADILAHGVPNVLDTGPNESHHKLTKLLAKLTQRDVKFFEGQTAQRMIEFLLLEFAVAELDGKTMWEHFVLDQERGPLSHEEEFANDEGDFAPDA